MDILEKLPSVNAERESVIQASVNCARIFATSGAAIGPVASGRIFDVSGSYAIAFSVFAAMWLGAALAIYACLPLEQEIVRLRTRTT